MQRTKTAVVIHSQNRDESDQSLQTVVLRSFSDPESTREVVLIRHDKNERSHALQEWFDRNTHNAGSLILLDADQLRAEAAESLPQYIAKQTADICCVCVPAPKSKSFDADRKRYARYLSEHSAALIFSEKALLRMETADTTDLVEEAIADPGLSVAFLPIQNDLLRTESTGMRRHISYIRHTCSAGRIWSGCAAASLFGAFAFLILMLLGYFGAGLIGCIVCVHVFALAAAINLIRWYRGSVKLEQKRREHPYVEESHLK